MEAQGDRLASSNAGDLLNVPAVCEEFAYGEDSELGAEFEAISALLTTAHEIELMNPRPHRIGSIDIFYMGTAGFIALERRTFAERWRWAS